jgi:CO/xanthine dehydrogenase Mo-binding subunit
VVTVPVESGDACGPFGAKGIGEPAMIPTAPAILNAIEDAVGIRLYEMPATPDKVLAALKAREG